MSLIMKYAIFYFKPEPHRYAFHTTHFWLWAKFILWLLKRKGYNEAYIDRNVSDLKLDCIKEYGWEFGEKYDKTCQGIPIGNLEETVKFLEKVEYVKKKLKS